MVLAHLRGAVALFCLSDDLVTRDHKYLTSGTLDRRGNGGRQNAEPTIILLR